MGLARMVGEEASALPLAPDIMFLLGEPAGQHDADIIVDVPVGRDLVVAAMRAEGQQLAARGARRDHVIGKPEPKRVRFVRHSGAKLSAAPMSGKRG